MEFFAEHLLEFILGIFSFVITTVLGIVIKHMADKQKKIEADATAAAEAQEKEYKRLLKDEQTRNYREMILKELKPIIDEIAVIKANSTDHVEEISNYIEKDEQEFEVRLGALKAYHISDRDEVADEINKRTKELERKLLKIVESYKFRFIQLCQTHLQDGYITSSEWAQITAFYDVYSGLGGNGQAEDYYEQVKKLDIIPDNHA